MAGSRVERAVNRENAAAAAAAGKGAMNPPAANTRRALGDLSNLVVGMSVRCHVSKDGVVVPGKNNNHEEVVTTWGAKQRRTAVAEKNAADSVAENDVVPVTAPLPPVHNGQHTMRTKPPTRSGRAVKKTTLTAQLTARSEACGGFDAEMHEAEDQLPNIDEADIGNQLAVVDYVEDMYSFYRRAEEQSCVSPDYMCRQPEINDKMRAILIDWLIEVHEKFDLMPETLFLTTNLIDRYLSTRNVPRHKLQLVGVTAMLIAGKYEEVIAPEVASIVFISDDAYSRQQVLAMEKAMLNTLRFNLTVPTPYVFMVRFLKAACSDKQMELLAFFFVELCLTEYVMVKYPPSLLAAAAVYTAHHTLLRTPCWSPTLTRHTGYAETQLKDCAGLMAHFHRNAPSNNLVVVHQKYSNIKFHSVASLHPANLESQPSSLIVGSAAVPVA